ncbi:MAG: HU family DNA-binding protein [Brooklawnia sp.]
MNYLDLVKKIATDTGLGVKKVDAVLDSLRDTLKAAPVGDRTSIPRMGTFEVKRRKARTITALNGQQKEVPERTALTFRASKTA